MEEFVCFGVMILLFTLFGLAVGGLLAEAIAKVVFKKK